MTKRQRHWKTSWNRHRTVRLVLSCSEEEAKLVRGLAEASGQTVQSYLMHLVLRAAARSRRLNITTEEGRHAN
jgi:uncharacterized protein (DUF1778 family)